MDEPNNLEKAAQAAARMALQKGPEVKELLADESEKGTRRKVGLVLGATGVVVVGIGVMALLAKLWFYAISLAVLAGVGGAGYLVVRPKLRALGAARERKRLEAQQQAQREAQEQAARDAARAAVEAKAREAQKLEEQLAALKRKL